LSFFPRFQKKSAAGFSWQRISSLFDYKLLLFHDQASYGEANYDDANYNFTNNDRVHNEPPASCGLLNPILLRFRL
jgi:hypothetical protein